MELHTLVSYVLLIIGKTEHRTHIKILMATSVHGRNSNSYTLTESATETVLYSKRKKKPELPATATPARRVQLDYSLYNRRRINLSKNRVVPIPAQNPSLVKFIPDLQW